MSDDKKASTFGADAPGTVTLPEVVIQPYPTIRKGSRGATVAKWQRMIGVTADGNFGSGTDAATRTWQLAHGLTPDGVVGVASWAEALKTTTPAGMLALEWNQVSAEIPAPPAPPTVIPPVAGAMPIGDAQVAVTFTKPGATTATKATVTPMQSGVLGNLGTMPTWAKVLGFLGIGGAVMYYGNKGKR